MVVFGKGRCIRATTLYSGKMDVFGQKWYYSSKRGCIQAKVLYSGKSESIRDMWLYSLKSGCIRAKVGCNQVK